VSRIVADVWLVDPADTDDLVPRYVPLLSTDEAARYEGLRVATARRQLLVSRVLVRTVLAARLGVAPPDVELRTAESGRPEVAGRPLDFNLSHTDGLVALAVTDGAPVGVDVERYDRDVDPLALAKRFFAPDENAALVAAGDDERRALFVAQWTVKEAYVKARGVGIARGLRSIAVTLDGADIRGTPDGWRFASWEPTPRHRAALAVRTDGSALEVRVRRAVPLVRDEPVPFRPVAATPS
jgi:4'-phosphopantetheinyl transferase